MGSSENTPVSKPAVDGASKPAADGADRLADSGRPVQRARTSILAAENHPREPFSRLNLPQVWAENSAEGPRPKSSDELGKNVKRTESGLQLGWEDCDPRNPLDWVRERLVVSPNLASRGIAAG